MAVLEMLLEAPQTSKPMKQLLQWMLRRADRDRVAPETTAIYAIQVALDNGVINNYYNGPVTQQLELEIGE